MNNVRLHGRAMLSRRALLILAAVLAAFAAVLAFADQAQPTVSQESGEDPGYIKFSGLSGEATDRQHVGWSDILSFEQGTSRSSPTLEITKAVDTTSPKLELAWLKGTRFAQVDLELTKSGTLPVAFYLIRLKNVTLGGYTAASSDLAGQPMEAFRLRFDWMRLTYVPIGADGTPGAAVIMTWLRP